MCALCRHSARRLGKEQSLRKLSCFVRLDASSGWPSSHRLMPSKLLRAVLSRADGSFFMTQEDGPSVVLEL